MRFSFEFSSSSCFRRLASLTSIPPYLLRHPYNVAALIPCCRHSSLVLAPASLCFNIPMIFHEMVPKLKIFLHLVAGFRSLASLAMSVGSAQDRQSGQGQLCCCL